MDEAKKNWELLREAERLAEQHQDGHLTIMRFTGGWKVMFSTPVLDLYRGRPEVERLVQHETLEDALAELCKQEAMTGGPE